ncbi:hypothetical protein QJS10_CPB15g01224 [Acorus calamus]|uniref:Endonuclease/exonuclease/phosphatase domain-containing protein n=1 Tax=Acorus calamus TaxID=4465 RepID=A0AAV9D5P5_ACOCL|nr:hypothetical protein QJS10_CPB15g01224 [Acorus calamus]
MNFIFWNVRGVKGNLKQLNLKDFLNRHRPQFLCLTEAKLDETSLFSLKRKLGGYLPSSHLATYSLYASNYSSERLALWDSIERLASSTGTLGWIVGGDFNEVRYSNEKMGGTPEAWEVDFYGNPQFIFVKKLANVKKDEKFVRKSRQLWLNDGDSNTKFFYNSTKSRSGINTISRLRREDGSICSDPDKIKAALTVQFYQNLLNRDASLDILFPPPPGSISAAEDSTLCSPILGKELRSTIFGMKAFSSLGPDGDQVKGGYC